MQIKKGYTGFNPVSYTHLDVYKRQLLILILKMLSSSSVPFRVLNVIVQSLSSPKSVLICLSSQVPNVYVAGLV